METTVEDKLRGRDVGHPVVVSSVGKKPEVTFDFLVGSFCLAIGLRVVRGGERVGNTKFGIEGLHQACRKLRASIGDNLGGDAVKSKDLSVMDVRHSFCIDI
jgi:hypothetical protein